MHSLPVCEATCMFVLCVYLVCVFVHIACVCVHASVFACEMCICERVLGGYIGALTSCHVFMVC